jgi:hypothetical protein
LCSEHCNSLGNYGLFHKKITRDYERALFYLVSRYLACVTEARCVRLQKRATEVAEFPEDKLVWRRRHDRLSLELQAATK